jgi:hypothetical protein
MRINTRTNRKKSRTFSQPSKRKPVLNSRYLQVNQKPDIEEEEADRITAHDLFSLFTGGIIKKNTDFVR